MPPPPSGELVLEAAHPVIDAQVAGVPLRLRVDLDQQGSVSLNPDAAAKLALPWQEDVGIDVGRVHLTSRSAATMLVVAGRKMPLQVTEYGRACCRDADGTIGPDLLPYAAVRWTDAAAPAPSGSMLLPLIESDTTGLSAASDLSGLRIHFALGEPSSIATAAGGAILARAGAGRWNGGEQRVVVAFGVARPVRPMTFDRPVRLAGFRIADLFVRLSDFAGDEKLPTDPVEQGDVVVRHALRSQMALPAARLGWDRLSRCAEIRYDAPTRSLTLRCAFDTL